MARQVIDALSLHAVEQLLLGRSKSVVLPRAESHHLFTSRHRVDEHLPSSVGLLRARRLLSNRFLLAEASTRRRLLATFVARSASLNHISHLDADWLINVPLWVSDILFHQLLLIAKCAFSANHLTAVAYASVLSDVSLSEGGSTDS
jgi:hypothetical protein